MCDENYLERTEQLRHDRDKYVGLWRSQCNIAEDVMRERDRMTAELAGANKYKQELSTELTAYMVACENLKGQLSGERIRAEQAEAELARYKQGVEVEVTVDSYDYGDTSFICEDIKLPNEFRGQRVRVLVMKVEE